MVSALLNLLFPKICYACGSNGGYLCKRCLKQRVNFNWVQKCHVCGSECRVGMVHKECSQVTYLDGLIWVCLYDGAIERMIREIKYAFVSDILNDFGKIMADFLDYYKLGDDFCLMPVPLHRSKLNKRGFNQSEVLAKIISQKSGLIYLDAIKRVRKTKTQVGLSQKEREVNLKNAFEVKKPFVEGKNVLLVDDVYTTGTTMSECAKVLKESGVNKVVGFAFAKSRI